MKQPPKLRPKTKPCTCKRPTYSFIPSKLYPGCMQKVCNSCGFKVTLIPHTMSSPA